MARPSTVEEIEAQLCRVSLAEFVQRAWHVLEPGVLHWGWHQQAICEHLEAQARGEIRDLIINVPPRSSKSSITSIALPAWMWANDPSERFVCSSYSQSLSLDLGLQQRRLVESDWYRTRFPHVRIAPDAAAKAKFDTTRQGFRISTSTGGTVTGKGGGWILADDPHSTKKGESAADRKNVITHWRQTLSNRGNDAKSVRRTIIMQRVHEADLSGELLSDGGWEHLCIPQEFEDTKRRATGIGWTDPRTEEGELLQPDRMGPKEVAQAKLDMGPYAYAGQHQQRPAPMEGGIFKAAWWRFWRYAWEDDIPELKARTVVINPTQVWDRQLLSFDCAFKKTDDSDLVCGGVWGCRGAENFLLDCVWERLDFVETAQQFQAMTEKWPDAIAKLVEEAANGFAIINSFRAKIPGVLPIKPQGGKDARAYATSPLVAAGNVFLPLHWRKRDAYILEHSSFPNATHDDAVDMQSQALNYILANEAPSFPSDLMGEERALLRRRA